MMIQDLNYKNSTTGGSIPSQIITLMKESTPISFILPRGWAEKDSPSMAATFMLTPSLDGGEMESH